MGRTSDGERSDGPAAKGRGNRNGAGSGPDEVVDHFTLNGEETGWLRNKTGATRLGFAVQMKFLLWCGRFPKMRLELPRDAVEYVARQVGVAAGELAAYDFASRTAQRHRTELRDLTGWHECTRTDMVKLTSCPARRAAVVKPRRRE
ncbi:hypothetical protein GCM10010211_81180 [Streptomyces albospinus]|uniref:DUF4158 domain-containing protein n=1 Tax=Streptomyces albospinus TaxID=285515 RepID=A0ABQ2VQ34_9ACTN|nr:DUF4158 domain-containing protein [Streptomyces albospinus]GGV01652.1 hypothetical protein GCM10010211_81180 [Streptomyces albospinus]